MIRTLLHLVLFSLVLGVALFLIPAAAQDAAPTFPPAASEETSTSSEDASEDTEANETTESTKPSFPGFDVTKSSTRKHKIKSLFFSQEEITDIHLAVNTYLSHIGRGSNLPFDEEAFLQRLGGIKRGNTASQSRFYTYPQFFLESLVYDAKSQWSIRLNGRTILHNTPQEGSNVRVTAITPERVSLEWAPPDMERVMEIWKRFPNDTITVDAVRSRVSFALKPNQTFSSYVMNVLEGKVEPVSVDITRFQQLQSQDGSEATEEDGPLGFDKAAEKPKQEPAATTPLMPKPQDDPSRQGLSGLLNSYKNMESQR